MSRPSGRTKAGAQAAGLRCEQLEERNLAGSLLDALLVTALADAGPPAAPPVPTLALAPAADAPTAATDSAAGVFVGAPPAVPEPPPRPAQRRDQPLAPPPAADPLFMPWVGLAVPAPAVSLLAPPPALEPRTALEGSGAPVTAADALRTTPGTIDAPPLPVVPPAPPPAPVAPTITLAAETTNVPVNANRTNGSNWRAIPGNPQPVELVGLPLIRDFDLAPIRNLAGWTGAGEPPAGAPVADPELKRMTVTVTNGAPAGAIRVEVVYPNAFTGGRVRLWADQTKSSEVALAGGRGVAIDKFAQGTGTLTAYPTATFYVEGTRPSLQAGDVTLRVSHTTAGGQTVTDEAALTVTPVVNEFSVNPKNPPAASFAKTLGGDIYGISSGDQPNGGVPGSTKPGVKYTADLNVKGIGGDARFVQNVTGLSHANPAVVLTDGSQFNPSFGTATFPLVDSVTDLAPIPFYPNLNGLVYDADRQMIGSFDTPALGKREFAGQIESMDLTFQARMYLVWTYADGTIYTLARADWQSVFRAATVPNVGLTLSADAVTTANPKVITNADPARVIGPTYNSFLADANTFWQPVGGQP